MKQIQKCKVAQSVKLLLSSSADKDSKRNLDRATITKIILLLEAEDVNSSTKGASNRDKMLKNELLRASC